MIDANKTQNITNYNETKENLQEKPNNLHIIKCVEKNTELIYLNTPNTKQLLLMQTASNINKKSTIILGVISIIFIIISLSTLIKNNKSYLNIKENLKSNTNKTYTKFWKGYWKI